MNRSEFIKSIMDLYPGTFNKTNPEQYQGWINRYKNAIPENWDFDKLMWYFDNDWNSTIVPPHPSFFRKYSENVKPTKSIIEPKIEITKEQQKENEENFRKFQEKVKNILKNKTIN